MFISFWSFQNRAISVCFGAEWANTDASVLTALPAKPCCFCFGDFVLFVQWRMARMGRRCGGATEKISMGRQQVQTRKSLYAGRSALQPPCGRFGAASLFLKNITFKKFVCHWNSFFANNSLVRCFFKEKAFLCKMHKFSRKLCRIFHLLCELRMII